MKFKEQSALRCYEDVVSSLKLFVVDSLIYPSLLQCPLYLAISNSNMIAESKWIRYQRRRDTKKQNGYINGYDVVSSAATGESHRLRRAASGYYGKSAAMGERHRLLRESGIGCYGRAASAATGERHRLLWE